MVRIIVTVSIQQRVVSAHGWTVGIVWALAAYPMAYWCGCERLVAAA